MISPLCSENRKPSFPFILRIISVFLQLDVLVYNALLFVVFFLLFRRILLFF